MGYPSFMINSSLNSGLGLMPTAASFNPISSLSGPPAQAAANLGRAYQESYNAAFQRNATNFNDIMRGYQQTMAAQQAALGNVDTGYANLNARVQNQIRGTDAAERMAIRDRYAAEAGNQMQGLISRGLGNTTVQNSVMRGLTFDESKAGIDLSNRMAQLSAGYQSTIGMARMGSRYNAALANSGLAQNQLQFMNSVQSPYPDVGMYANLAMQYGMMAQGRRMPGVGGVPSLSASPVRSGGPIGGPGPTGGYGGGFDLSGQPNSGFDMYAQGYGGGSPMGGGYSYAGAVNEPSPVSYWKGYDGSLVPGYGGGPQSQPDYSAAYAAADPMF